MTDWSEVDCGEDYLQQVTAAERLLHRLSIIYEGIGSREGRVNNDEVSQVYRIVDSVDDAQRRLADVTKNIEALANAININVNRITPEIELSVEERSQKLDKLGFGFVTFDGGWKSIHLGKVNRVITYPIAQSISAHALLYIIRMSDTKDILLKEIHGVKWGWHYHYCKNNKDRSDTILSFDIQRTQPCPHLCWETHAANKAKFDARPYMWSQRKRESVYSACSPDLEKHDLNQFKRPGSGSGLVWPYTKAL